MQQVELVRDSAVAVLLGGEPGAGKGAVARAIHTTGLRGQEPFVQLDCAELPGEVIGPVLYGDREEGRLELARAGTLYLEGIDCLPLDHQGRLLEVLERGTVTRSGGKRIVPVNARLVAAARTDLRRLVAEGGFRKELFCRLNVFPIVIPPLRQRREDIAPSAQRFLERFREERMPPVRAIEERAIVALKSYDWPGNVAELETVILDAVMGCDKSGVIRLDHLPQAIRSNAPAPSALSEPAIKPVIEGDAIVPLAELERLAILHALRVTGGNVTRAARALGIGRATMYRKLDRFKVSQ